jgi:flagellar motility protein MotE (MotC chaperone)
VISLIALLILAAAPVEPTPPVVPVAVAPEVKLPAGAEAKKSAPPPAVEAEPKPVPVPEVKKPDEKPKEEPEAIAPSLGKKALCGELTRSGRELASARKRLDDDRKGFELEKQTLEKLKAEIADSRIQLRAETTRLERLLAKRSEGGGADGEKQAPAAEAKPKPAAPRPPELDALARTMKSMKPEAAAALLQRTDPTLAAGVLKRMKPAEAGAVMDKLKPDVAADLMALMATMPTTPSKAGHP